MLFRGMLNEEFAEEFAEEIAEAKEEARVEGRAEGHAEGHAEGKAEGRAEGRAEGQILGKVEFVLSLLEDLGFVSDELREKIQSETDLQVLAKWHKLAAKADSIEQFLKDM